MKENGIEKGSDQLKNGFVRMMCNMLDIESFEIPTNFQNVNQDNEL